MAVQPKPPRQPLGRSVFRAMCIFPIVPLPALPERRQSVSVRLAMGVISTAMGTGSAANDAVGRS